jgi:hypothetical protein
VVGLAVAIRPALPCGRSRGGELGEERGLTGGSRSSAAEAWARGWAGFAHGSGPGLVQSGDDMEKTAHDPFPIFKFLFQLNKSTGGNKKQEKYLGTSKNVKFCMEIDLNIFHNFCIGHFDQR